MQEFGGIGVILYKLLFLVDLDALVVGNGFVGPELLLVFLELVLQDDLLPVEMVDLLHVLDYLGLERLDIDGGHVLLLEEALLQDLFQRRFNSFLNLLHVLFIDPADLLLCEFHSEDLVQVELEKVIRI